MPVRRSIALCTLLAIVIVTPLTAPAEATRAPTLAQPLLASLARHSNPALGYAISYPASWTPASGVHWTSAGPAADFTAVQPDQAAMMGVLVAPTGGRSFTDADLLLVADNFINQQDEVQSNQIAHGTITLNGLHYVQATALYHHGGEVQAFSWITVLVTVQRHRLYLLAGLVFDCVIRLPSGGVTPTPTETPLGNAMSVQSVPSGASAAVPTVLPGLPARAQPLVNAATAPRLTMARSFNADYMSQCASLIQAGILVVKLNAQYMTDRLVVSTALATMGINPQAAIDRRPAPAVGVDGFAQYSDPAAGLVVGYPAQWQRVPNSSADFTVGAADGKAILAISVQPTGSKHYTLSALTVIATHLVYQVGNVIGKSSSRTLTTASGALVAVVDNSLVTVSTSPATAGGVPGTAQLRVSAEVAVYHRRIYAVVSVVLHISSSLSDYNDVQPPFFAPFAPAARAGGFSNFDTHGMAQQLALASMGTADIAPAVAPSTQPAPGVEIDGFATHSNPSAGYSISYPAQWQPISNPQADFTVQSSDGRVVFFAVVQSVGSKTYTVDDLKGVVDAQLAQVGTVGGVTYQTVQTAHATYLVVNVKTLLTQAGSFSNRTATAVATVQHGNLYLFEGLVTMSTSAIGSLNYAISAQDGQLVFLALNTISI